MKKIVFFLSLSITSMGQKAGAQVTDSIFVTDPLKQYLYTSLPEGTMLDSKGNSVRFMNFIKTERPFKNKPTLFITWSDRFCPPCIRLIDSILANNIHKRYNVVLVNKEQAKNEKEPIDAVSLTKKLSDARPSYSGKAISLFDTHDILNSIDQGTAPAIFWMDKNLDIAMVLLSYGIRVSQVEDILAKIDNKTIEASTTKLLTASLYPALNGDAMFKITTEEANGVYTFTLNLTRTNVAMYRLKFTKTPEGYFVYHKSSLHVPKVEELYNEAEIAAAVKKMLSSLNAKTVDELKGSKERDNLYKSNLTLKNFNNYIFEDEKNIMFANNLVHPALDRSSKSKKQEFHLIAKALATALSVQPKQEKGTYTKELTNTYTINKDVQVVLKENGNAVYFNLVVNKDSQGNIPDNAGKRPELASSFNTGKLCDAVTRIRTELGKKNKSGILGEKNEDGFVSLMQVENFNGNIRESNSYFRYTGYIKTPTYENGIYGKEFEIVSTRLQNCLDIEPVKDRSWQSSDTFMAANTMISVGMNSKSTNMWIEITVMK